MAKADRGRTWGEFAVGVTSFHLRQSGCQHPAARCRCDQRVVDIGKVCARLREEPIAIGGDFLPIGRQTCLAGKREPPEQRGAIREHVQGRIWRARRPDVLLVDRKRSVQIAGL